MAPGSAQRAAWDAYLALTVGLLPALDDEHVDDRMVNARLGGVAIRIHRYAPMWPGDGPMLVAAVHSAIRLYRSGDRPALVDLLHVLAPRLYLLSAGRRAPRRPGRRNQQAP